MIEIIGEVQEVQAPDFEKMSPELLHLLDKWVCTDMEEEMKKGL